MRHISMTVGGGITDIKTYGRYLSIILAVAAADQLCKFAAPRLGLTVSMNTGTAFGLFRGAPTAVTFFAVAALLAMLFVIFARGVVSSVVKTALAVAGGGTVANVADRFARGGVLDWIYLPFSDIFWSGGLRFNIADAAIGLGLFAAAVVLCLGERGDPNENDKAS